MRDENITGTVEDVHGDRVQVSADFDHAHGGYKVKLNPDADRVPGRSAWLLPSAARGLITALQAGIAQAEARNLDEYGHRDGTDPGPQEQDEPGAAQVHERVHTFLSRALDRDDMGLDEIATEVIRIAQGQS